MLFLPLILAVLLFTGCHKEYFELERLDDEVELNTQLLAPLIYGSLHMTDLMEIADSIEYIGEFDDGLIYVAYSDTFISAMADTLLDTPDLESTEFYLDTDTDIPVWLPEDTVVIPTRTKSVVFELEGENRIDSLVIKEGQLGLDVSSTFRHEGQMQLTSEQILGPDGNPARLIIDIDDASGNFNRQVWIPSDHYRIVPLVRNDSNIIYMNFDLTLYNSGQPISPGEQCVVRVRLEDYGFYGLYGFLDAGDLAQQSGDIDIPLWSDNPDLAAIQFGDPRFVLTTHSSIGIPMILDFDSVIATGLEGEKMEFVLDAGNHIEFGAPALENAGEMVSTTIEVTRETSNIDEFLQLAPVNITYRGQGRTAIVNDDSLHFVLDTSRLHLAGEFLLPLDFRSTGYALTDTMAFELGEEGIDTSLIRGAYLTIYTENELPVELELQALLLDDDYHPVDSVFSGVKPILEASVVDVNGNLTQASEAETVVEFPLEKLAKLDRVRHLQVRGRVMTSAEGQPFVKIYSQYTLDFKLSFKAEARINTEEMQ